MRYLIEALSLLIELAFSLASLLFLLRVLLPLVHANFYNPISQTIYRSTQRILAPLRKVLRPLGKVETSAVLIVFLLQMLKLGLLFALRGQAISAGGLGVLALAEALSLLVSTYFWMILARAILSLAQAGGSHHALPLLHQLTEPVLRPLRQRLPPLGGFDLSPLVATVFLLLIRILVIAPLLDLGLLLTRT